jgi:hypothetical protein
MVGERTSSDGSGRVGAPRNRRANSQSSAYGVSGCGLFALSRLEAIEIGDRFLRLGGGGKHRAWAGLHYTDPVVNIARVLGMRLHRQAELGAQERGAEFGALS